MATKANTNMVKPAKPAKPAKTIAKSKLRPGKNLSLGVTKAIKQLTDLKSGGDTGLVDAYDALEEKYDNDAKNMSYSAKRKNLIKTVEDRADDLDRQNKQREKDIGASKQTIQVLKCMAVDEQDFIRLCDLWNRGDPGVKKSKRVFEELMNEEKHEYNGIMVEAWRHKPEGCGSLRSALLAYSKRFLDLRRVHGPDFLVAGNYKLEMEKAGDDAVAVTVLSRLESIRLAIKTIDDVKSSSSLTQYFPGCYRMCQLQEASAQVRQMQFHHGGPLDDEVKFQKFPVLKPLPKTTTRAPDVEPSASSFTRPPSPSLVDYQNLEAAEAEVQRLRILNDKQEEGEEEDEEGEGEEGGGYVGEQLDVFRQVFGGEDEEESEEESEEENEENKENEEEAEEEAEEEVKEEASVERMSTESDGEESSSGSVNRWHHDDENMMFAEAFAAREEASEELSE
jgi:hypothetical protein